LGMNLFGGRWDFPDGGTPRKNFDTLYWATATVFQVLTIEDWNQVMYHAVRRDGLMAATYFISLVVFGNLILLNLFVAILIEGFSTDEEDEDEEDEAANADGIIPSTQEAAIDKTNPPVRETNPGPDQGTLTETGTTRGCTWGGNLTETAGPEGYATPSSSMLAPRGAGSGVAIQSHDEAQRQDQACEEANPPGYLPGVAATRSPSVEAKYEVQIGNGGSAKFSNGEGNMEAKADEESKGGSKVVPEGDLVESGEPGLEDEPDYSDEALPIHAWARAVVGTSYFENTIMLMILLSSVTLAMERPSIKDDSAERNFLTVSGHIFTVVFCVEMILKVAAFYFMPYIQNTWNQLDFFLVLVSLVDLLLMVLNVRGGMMIKMLRILRMLRSLRPLRMISRAPGLKMVVQSLITSLKPLSNTLVIIVFIFLIFGILGTQMMKGMMWNCAGLSDEQMELVITKQDCLNASGTWENLPYNFDHLGNAILTLFVVASIDGWVDIMYQGVDTVGVDMQPKQNASEGMLLFFVGFILVGAFFVMNMFVGIVVENFQRCRVEQDEQDAQDAANGIVKETVNEEDADATEFDMDILSTNPCQNLMQKIARSNQFDLGIALIIMLNVLSMALEHYDQPEELTVFMIWLNVVFTVIFIGEAVIKSIADGPSNFIVQKWNQFDVFIVFVSIIGCVFDLAFPNADNLPINPTILRILRILRIARILKLLKKAKNLCLLLDGVKRALPQVGNLCILLLLMFFIFSALGIQLFGRLACSEANPCSGLSNHAHFEDFGYAMLTLFRITTGDNWAGIMKDTLREPPACDDADDCLENCCASRILSPIFFIVFCLITQFVLLNIVVAVMMEELEGSIQDMASTEREEQRRTHLVLMKLFKLWRGDNKERVLAQFELAKVGGLMEWPAEDSIVEKPLGGGTNEQVVEGKHMKLEGEGTQSPGGFLEPEMREYAHPPLLHSYAPSATGSPLPCLGTSHASLGPTLVDSVSTPVPSTGSASAASNIPSVPSSASTFKSLPSGLMSVPSRASATGSVDCE